MSTPDYTPPTTAASNIDDAATAAPNYQAPQQVTANTDIQALIASAVAAALQQQAAAVAAAAAPKVLTPEEEARAALDNAGAGLGIEERLRELYRHIELIARKVGI